MASFLSSEQLEHYVSVLTERLKSGGLQPNAKVLIELVEGDDKTLDHFQFWEGADSQTEDALDPLGVDDFEALVEAGVFKRIGERKYQIIPSSLQ